MERLSDYWYRLKSYFAFSPEEVKGLFIAIVVLSFIVGFDDGSETFVFANWIINFFNSLLIVTLSVLVRESVHHAFALRSGHKSEFRLWGLGLGISLLVAVLSQGSVPLLVYGGIAVTFIPRHRLGYFRYHLSYMNMATIAMWGNLATLLLALFFKCFLFLPNPLIQKAIVLNVLIACTNMLPIPPLTGHMILFASRTYYVFSIALIGIMAGLILIPAVPVWVALIGSLVAAGLIALTYNIFGELAS